MSEPFTPQNLSIRHSFDSPSIKKLISTEPRHETQQSAHQQRLDFDGLSPYSGTPKRKRTRDIMQEKLHDLRRKKDAVKQAVKRKLERGARRILANQRVNRLLSYARRERTSKAQDNINQQEEVDTSFSSEQQPSEQKILPFSVNKTIQFSDGMLATEKDETFPLLTSIGMPQVPSGKRAYYKLSRSNSGLSYFTPSFVLQEAKSGQKLLFGKKVSPFTFLIQNRQEWGQQSPSYLGKLVSNMTGSQISCYLSVGEGIQQLVGSICYKNSYLQFTKPRTIQVYFYNFYRFFQFKPLSQIKSIKKLLQNQQYAPRVIKFKSRQPMYNAQTRTYSMNFGGRAAVRSVKNCILQDPQHPGRDALLLAKQAKDRYSLDFIAPLSPFMAFAIALTNFNGKIINE